MSAVGIPIPFTITIGALPPNFDGEPQALLNQLEEILQISLNEGVAFFTVGASAPTSNIGPWFNTSTTPGQWEAWSNALGMYIPVNVPQTSLQYIVSSVAPDHTVYQLWFQTDASGNPVAVNMWDTALATPGWAPFGSMTPLLLSQIAAYFGGVNTTPTPNQINVNWGQLTGVPQPLSGTLSGTTAQQNALNPPGNNQLFFNTDISVMLIYYSGSWHTLDGSPGDLKWVNNASLAGALTLNPGWSQYAPGIARSLIAAGNGTPQGLGTYTPGQTGGQETITLNQTQIPASLTGLSMTLPPNNAGAAGNSLGLATGLTGTPVVFNSCSITNPGGGQPTNIQSSYIGAWLLIKN